MDIDLYIENLTFVQAKKLLLDTVFELQKSYEVDLGSDLGFGYSVEETLKHFEDESKEGKKVLRLYKLFLLHNRAEKIYNRKFKLNI